MIWLGALNFVVLQWFGVRLARVDFHCDEPFTAWRVLRWIAPLTGWWSDYRYFARSR